MRRRSADNFRHNQISSVANAAPWSTTAPTQANEGWPLKVGADPDATRSPRRRNPAPATVVAADPPRSAADEEDSAVTVHEPAVAVEGASAPRARTAAVPGANAGAADSGAAAHAAAYVTAAPATTHAAVTTSAMTVRERNRGQQCDCQGD